LIPRSAQSRNTVEGIASAGIPAIADEVKVPVF